MVGVDPHLVFLNVTPITSHSAAVAPNTAHSAADPPNTAVLPPLVPDPELDTSEPAEQPPSSLYLPPPRTQDYDDLDSYNSVDYDGNVFSRVPQFCHRYFPPSLKYCTQKYVILRIQELYYS